MKNLSITCMLLAGLSLAGAGTGTPEQNLLFRHSQKSERVIIKPVRLFTGASLMKEEEREPNGPGFFANFGVFNPSPEYMDPYHGEFYNHTSVYKTGIMLDIGNFFRVLNNENIALGVRASWLQLGYGKHQDTSFSAGNAFGSPLRVGPQAGIRLGDNVGLDLFYQLGVQYNIDWWHKENLSYAGFSHELGISARYTLFTAGLGFRFGALKNVDTSDPKTRDIDAEEKYAVKCLRLFLGIQL